MRLQWHLSRSRRLNEIIVAILILVPLSIIVPLILSVVFVCWHKTADPKAGQIPESNGDGVFRAIETSGVGYSRWVVLSKGLLIQGTPLSGRSAPVTRFIAPHWLTLPANGEFSIEDESAGWPFRCLHGRTSSDSSGVHETGYLHIGLRHNRPLIPVHIIWSGLFVDSMSVYIVLIILRIGWGLYLGHRRSRQDLCRSCGYDTSGLVLCPECGVAVSLRRAVPRGAGAQHVQR
jgi:hypothetical protein